MAQVDPLKKASTVEKMNGRSPLLSSNKMSHCFKEWRTANGVLKRIYCLYKNFIIKIDPRNGRKLQYPVRKLRL